MKLHLQGTDYGQFLANEPSPLSVSTIDDKLREKLVIEFQHLRNHAVEPLSTFLDFITYSYMIDNIILLITGTLHQRPINELIPKCHPLGSFEQMEAIHVAATPAELYNAVLVDTPLAPFFVDCISEQDLDEMNIEIIRNTLYKAYLEAFYEFCKGIGGTTADVMCEILAVSDNYKEIVEREKKQKFSQGLLRLQSINDIHCPLSSRPIVVPSSSRSTRSARSCPRTTAPSCTRVAER